MFENKGQHLTQCSPTNIHEGIPDLDGELLATTSKKQKWKNSTLRENCRAAFRYQICIEGLPFWLILTLSLYRRAEAERQLDGEPDPADDTEEMEDLCDEPVEVNFATGD